MNLKVDSDAKALFCCKVEKDKYECILSIPFLSLCFVFKKGLQLKPLSIPLRTYLTFFFFCNFSLDSSLAEKFGYMAQESK